MDLTKYLVTEFTKVKQYSLALRKPENSEFSVNEIKEISAELHGQAEIKPLYVSSLRNKMMVQAVICTFKNKQAFDAVMAEQTKSNDITKDGFVITGFYFDNMCETCTLDFYTPLFYQFNDEEMVSLCAEMYRIGAISVSNNRLNKESALYYRLFNFEIIEDKVFKEPVFRVSCTFKVDEEGLIIIDELFKKYSKPIKDLKRDCYRNCVISAYSNIYFTLSHNSKSPFDSIEVTKICKWLFNLGARSVTANVRSCYPVLEYPTECKTIECNFDDKVSFMHKLKEFVQVNEDIYIQTQKSMNNISADDTEYLPPFNIAIDSTQTSFKIAKNEKTDLLPNERFHFLVKLSQLGATKVTTNEMYINCEFGSNDDLVEAFVKLFS